MQDICFFLFNFDSYSMRSFSLVSKRHDKSCLNFLLAYFFCRTAKYRLHHFCSDMLMWNQISASSWGNIQTSLISEVVFNNYGAERMALVSQWLSLSGHFTCLKMSIHVGNVLFLSWGGLSQNTSRSMYSILSDLAVCVGAFFNFQLLSPIWRMEQCQKNFILLSIHKFKTRYLSPIHLKTQLKP